MIPQLLADDGETMNSKCGSGSSVGGRAGGGGDHHQNQHHHSQADAATVFAHGKLTAAGWAVCSAQQVTDFREISTAKQSLSVGIAGCSLHPARIMARTPPLPTTLLFGVVGKARPFCKCQHMATSSACLNLNALGRGVVGWGSGWDKGARCELEK